MDREQIEKWAREADAYMHRYCETNWYTPEEPQEIRDEHFARLVRDAALEEALAALRRYRNEVPLGHQPHMLAHEVDALLARIAGDAGRKG